MISTHILDTSRGHPAADVRVELELQFGDKWKRIGSETTNADGRISFNAPADAGTYRLKFHIDEYFQRNQVTPFFPLATVVFRISDTARKYHVPLLLNPYGYSTYRG